MGAQEMRRDPFNSQYPVGNGWSWDNGYGGAFCVWTDGDGSDYTSFYNESELPGAQQDYEDEGE